MSEKITTIYYKYVNGDSISNSEILEGYSFFFKLAKDLHKCGPVFKLSANEARKIADGLEGYARSRSLIEVD